MKMPANKSFHPPFSQNNYCIIEKYNMAFVVISKNGVTHLKNIAMYHKTGHYPKEEEVHELMGFNRGNGYFYSKSEIDIIEKEQGPLLKFAVWRDPVERLVSCYKLFCLEKEIRYYFNFLNLYNFLKDLTMLKSWEIRPAMNSLYQNSSNFDDIKADKKIIIDLYEYITHNISPESSFPIHLIRNVIDKEYFESARGSFSFKGARCSALNSHMFVLPDGKVTICEQLYWNPNFIIGDLLTQNIVDVWHSPRAEYLAKIKNEFIQEKSACKKCSIFSECFSSNNRCWADVIKAYGSKNWDFPDPRCSYAPKMIHKLNY